MNNMQQSDQLAHIAGKRKGKVVSVLIGAPCHDGMWGSRGKAPRS